MTWLEAWLDNVMASVPELAICYHQNGVVQGYELLKTDDIFLLKGISEDGTPAFHPQVVQQNGLSVLRFLQDNCKQDPGAYWVWTPKLFGYPLFANLIYELFISSLPTPFLPSLHDISKFASIVRLCYDSSPMILCPNLLLQLYKGAGEDVIQLFDLSVIPKNHSTDDQEKSCTSLPSLMKKGRRDSLFSLGILLYRIAHRLSLSKVPKQKLLCLFLMLH